MRNKNNRELVSIKLSNTINSLKALEDICPESVRYSLQSCEKQLSDCISLLKEDYTEDDGK